MQKVLFRIKTVALGIVITSMVTAMTGCDPDDNTTTPITVTDIDGNVYTTATIGSQIWTVENLRTTRYKDGTAIQTELDNSAWEDDTTGAYAIYDDDNDNNTVYGKLYNWHAVNTGKLAPEGWHVPTRAEWETLVAHLGGSTVAGGKMKSNSSLWNSPNAGATEGSLFKGLPGGYKTNSGIFALIGSAGYWWASTERNATQGNYLNLVDNLAGANINGANKEFGYSIRLIKD